MLQEYAEKSSGDVKKEILKAVHIKKIFSLKLQKNTNNRTLKTICKEKLAYFAVNKWVISKLFVT